MFNDMVCVSESLLLSEVVKHRNSEKRSGAEGQAQALYQMLEELDVVENAKNLLLQLERWKLFKEH